jgi:hypothetical protein
VDLWTISAVSNDGIVRKVERRNGVEINICIRRGSYDVLVCGGMCARRR